MMKKMRSRSAKAPQKFQFERLEPRQMMAAASLAEANSAVLTIGNDYDLNLVVNGGFDLTDEVGQIRQNNIPGWRSFADQNNERILDIRAWEGRGNVLELDSSSDRWDRIFQDFQTDETENYLLKFDARAGDGTAENSNRLSVVWDGEIIETIDASARWQSFAIEISGTPDELTRLEFREFDSTGNDGRGPLLDKIQLLPIDQTSLVRNGGFNQGPLDPDRDVYRISQIPNWNRGGDLQEREIRLGSSVNPNSGRTNYYLELDSFQDRLDSYLQNVETTPGEYYFVGFDLRSPLESVEATNQLRIRWNGEAVSSVVPTNSWETHIVDLGVATEELSRLILREVGDGSNGTGDGQGPWIDNVRIFSVDTSQIEDLEHVLVESDELLQEAQTLVELGQDADRVGSISFDLQGRFDFSDRGTAIEDLVNVSVLRPSFADDVLLDNGTEGGALFSYSGLTSEFAAGQTRFDGGTVTIDVTAVPLEINEVEVRFRLINNDRDDQTQVGIGIIRTELNQTQAPALLRTDIVRNPGPATELSGLVQNNDIDVLIENVRVNAIEDSYTAEVRLSNNGSETIGRNVALVFPFSSNVQFENESGIDEDGNPYLNVKSAIPFGGLLPRQDSEAIEIVLNTSEIEQLVLRPRVLVGEPNRAPDFPALPDLVLTPGAFSVTNLEALDPDGDSLTYSLIPFEGMPGSTINARNELVIQPTPTQIGDYVFEVEVSDGSAISRQSFNVTVEDDDVGTTRISGEVLDIDSSPLAGIPISLGGVTVVTDALGRFTLEFDETPTVDRLVIRGNEFVGENEYPFVAETIDLLFGRALFVGHDNQIGRPIYLPALDIAGGGSVGADQPVDVQVEVRPGETVIVEAPANSILDTEGNVFTGVLSITEVPPELTPAALPSNLRPEMVVTIQPGEMVFTTPAQITFPNSPGYEIGTVLDLWSINPSTGEFDNVGEMEVVADPSNPGSTIIVTTEGGIRNSSWHFPATPPTTPIAEDFTNEDSNCNECKYRPPLNFEVELHSGAVLESHELVSYQSIGRTWNWSLHYDSLRANPNQIVHFGFDNAVENNNQYAVASLEYSRGDFSFAVPGHDAGQFGLAGGEHIWRLDGNGTVRGAIQADLSILPSGTYQTDIESGLLQFNGGTFTGATTNQVDEFQVVNLVNSPFGAGWGLAELWEAIENPDGSVLLVEGGGSELYFGSPDGDGNYDSPPGDFSRLYKQTDGTFRREMTDQTNYLFNADNRLELVEDRNGNRTIFAYTDEGIISSIVDPAGLETRFASSNGRVTSITDPAGRITILQHDASGNLIQIEEPDQSIRRWDYDSVHQMTSHTDKRGNTETISYDFAGRASNSIRKDGTTQSYDPIQTQILLPVDLSTQFDGTRDSAPSISTATNIAGRYADANGNVSEVVLDRQGQLSSSADGEGLMPFYVRDNDNLVIETLDGRGNFTRFSYDERGNLEQVSDEVINDNVRSSLFPGIKFATGDRPLSVVTADINGDGINDLVTANNRSNDVSVLLGLGEGSFGLATNFAVGNSPFSIATGDFNSDGIIDLVTANSDSNDVSLLIGVGNGSFAPATSFSVEESPRAVVTEDFNGDGITDVLASSTFHLEVLVGVGDGTFQSASSFAAGNGSASVAAGDFNDDGIVDLAKPNRNSNEVTVLIGVGDGTFQSGTIFAVGDRPTSITSDDFNGDGIIDLATANRLSGESASVSILLGIGDGTFSSVSNFDSGSAAHFVTTGDFNSDGVTDLAVTKEFSNAVSILLGIGDGTFSSVSEFVVGGVGLEAATTGDFNRDGNLDIATANEFSDDVSVLWGSGDGTFVPNNVLPPSFAVGNSPQSVMTDDFNGDGVLDIVTANANFDFMGSNSLSVLLGAGDGTFVTASTIAASNSPRSVTTADFNNDGIVDLASSNQSTFSNQARVWLGNGDGTFSLIGNFATGEDPESITSGDFNGDGVADIVTANSDSDSHNVSVLLGVGDGTFLSASNFAVGDCPRDVVSGDLNGDGIADLATANECSDDVSVLLGLGDGTFSSASDFNVSDRPRSLTMGDFDGDGVIDLATANIDSDSISVLLGVGDGTFMSANDFSVGDGPVDITSGDVNGDGFLDLITADLTEGISILVGVGDGTFTSAGSFIAGPSPGSVATGDFNRDGILDLATASGGSEDVVSILLGIGGVGENARPRRFNYDPDFSQLTETVDEFGRRVIYEIDPENGNQLSMTEVIGQLDSLQNGESDDLITSMTYGEFGLIETMTDPLGRVTEYSYNERGLIAIMTVALDTPDEATMLYDYDAAGNRILMVDGEGNETRYEYDELNRLVTTIEQDPDGNGPLQSPVTRISYDAFGNLESVADANGNTTTNFYDELNRLAQTNSPDPDGSGPRKSPVTRFFYDPYGNLEETIDPNGHVTRYEYDSRNRRVSMTDPDGGIAQFEYDFDDNLIALTDPVGNRTTFNYDARDRLFAETDPFGNRTEYDYDAVDNLIRKTDRNGRVTSFAYDDIDRVIAEEWLDDEGETLNLIEYGYDKNSNLEAISDNQSSLTYTYDFRDRVKTVDNSGTAGLPNVVLTYTYDDANNLLSVSDLINGDSGATTGYEYDGLNRLAILTQTGAETSDKRVDFTYNDLGQYTAIDRYSDLTGTQLVIGTEYSYDGQNRLTRLDHQNSAGDSVAFYDYVYDTESRIRSITDIDGVADYRYDNRDQLTGADYSDSIRSDESYEYDANGNRVESHLHGNGYVTDLANRLILDGTYSYEYDNEGNMTRRTVEVEGGDTAPVGSYRVFEWDHRNRLIALIDFSPGGVITQSVEYRYDALDRRIEKNVDGVPTQFVYDREDVILDFVGVESSLDQRYLHGRGIDQVAAQENIQGNQWLLPDHLGTIRDLAASNGTVVNHISYDSFGTLINQVEPSLKTRYSFTGRELDSETNQHFYRYRYYDPNIGKFLNEDPLGLAMGLNVSLYVSNSPIHLIDPWGLEEQSFRDSISIVRGIPQGPILGPTSYIVRNAAREFTSPVSQSLFPELPNGAQNAIASCGAGILVAGVTTGIVSGGLLSPFGALCGCVGGAFFSSVGSVMDNSAITTGMVGDLIQERAEGIISDLIPARR